MKKRVLSILMAFVVFLMQAQLSFAVENQDGYETFDGKKVIFIGNSHTYRGLTVVDKDLTICDQASRSNDTGYFYQLCKARGADVSVTNWAFSGHGLYHMFGGNPCTHEGACKGVVHEDYLTDREFDYVFINSARGANSEATFLRDVAYIRNFFEAANPNVKFVILGTASSRGINQDNEMAYTGVTDSYKQLEEEGFIIADWGALVADVINGKRNVPGATKTFTRSSFIVSDNYHANALTGYLTTLFAYCAVTGEKAEGQPYDFCDNAQLNSAFDMYSYMSTWYTNGASDTNFYEIMQSDADMLGLQKLTDTMLTEKPYLESDGLAKSKDGVVFRMGLVSDTHIANEGEYSNSLVTAIDALNEVGGMDVLGLVGDIVWQADELKELPYTILKEILTAGNISNTTPGATPYIFTMGNHEHLYGVDDKVLCAEAVALFETQMEQPHNYHQEYNGYHVLAVGTASHAHQWQDGTFNYNEAWVMEEIEAIEAAVDYDPDKPIFVLMHYPVKDSVHRGVNNFAARHTEEFQAFLSTRPNIVNVSAHTHYALQLPQTICQDAGYTAFQSGVVGDITSAAKKSQISYIDVLENNTVKIYKIDLTTGAYIGQPWIIDIPAGKEGFCYTDEVRSGNTQAPTFTDDAEMIVNNIGNYSADLTFPTGAVEAKNGQQDDIIYKHRITVIKSETGEVVSTTLYDADYCYTPQPKTLTRTVNDLEIATKYTVTVEPMSMFGVFGEPLTAEFKTAGAIYTETLSDPIALSFDKALVGEVTDDAGTTSYDAVSNTNVLLRQGDYFTYTVKVGENEAIKEAGLYKLSYDYASKRDATISSSVKREGSDSFTEADSSFVLPASGGYAAYTQKTGEVILQLRTGTNTIKIAVSALANNDGIYFKAPGFCKVTSASYMDYPINTSVYNPITQTSGGGTGSIASNISTKTYQTASMLTMRQGDYVVVPVMVPATAAYDLDITVKSDKALPASKYKTAVTDESLEAAAALTAYSYTTDGLELTAAWQTFPAGNGIVMEAGKVYYIKIYASTVGRNHIAQISNIRLTDNGEYGTNANLSAISVSGGYMTEAITEDKTSYTVYTEMPNGGKVTLSATPEMEGVTVSGGGEIAVDYGINGPFPITVTSRNGKVTKHYDVTIVVAKNHASLGCTEAKLYVDGATEGKDVSRLLDGTGVVKLNGSSGAGFGVPTAKSAYIVIDLGAEYDLHKFTWERTNQGHSVKGITIWGSNDPEFRTYEHLGTTYDTLENGEKASDSLTHLKMTTVLSPSATYRYIRINKPSGTSKDFYPVKLDLYGVEAPKAENGSVVIPASHYAAGDALFAAVYTDKGQLKSVKTVTAENQPYMTIPVSKETDTDTVKIMVWKDFVNLVPRILQQTIN